MTRRKQCLREKHILYLVLPYLTLGLIGCGGGSPSSDDNSSLSSGDLSESSIDLPLSGDEASTVLDTAAPVITVTGDNPLEISQGETFSDPGATADDNIDDTVTVIPSGTVDMSIVGDYIITYTATDKAGNEASATRTVTVKPADVICSQI